jgi:CRISPR-associated endonuclease/helicase Cas3
LKTLQAVRRYRGGPWEKHSLGGPFDVVEISATAEGDGERFTLTEEDHTNPELSKRLSAPKPALLVETTRFEAEAAELAVKAQTGDVKVVGVIVNRVASAREIFRRLPGEAFEDKVLLTGRIRPWDRDALLDRCLKRMRAKRTRTAEDRPLFVVATMTVEVGADLDFDYLITEAAPLPALRQRFGRLDRLGRFGKAAGAILLRKAKGPDPIYGEDLAKTWEWLREQRDVFDFGVNALNELIHGASKAPPTITPRTAPVLFPAHLDAWVQTSPAPRPSPDVAPFLHGSEALETADVQVVWRADLHPDQTEEDWKEIVSAAPPRSREAMPLPLVAVQNWLRQGAPAEVADIEGISGIMDAAPGGRLALRWYGPEAEGTRRVNANEVRPGDTLVVPSEYGGADEFGWDPQSQEPVSDVGDLCINDMANAAPDDGSKRLIRLRLFEGVRTGQTDSEQLRTLDADIKKICGRLEEGEDTDSAVEALLTSMLEYQRDSPLMEAVIRLMTTTKRVTPYPAGFVLTARVRPGFYRAEAELPEAEDDGTDVDDSSSLRAGTQPPAKVTLEQHAEGVARCVELFASNLGVLEELYTALGQAAHFHDIGKADWRFQYLLYGDEPGELLLAKSDRDWNANQQAVVHERAGLPKGFRHEFVSVALIRDHLEQLLADLTDDQRRLVNYLVGTHHGRGRPFVPVIEDITPEKVSLRWDGHLLSASSDHGLWRLDSRWADQFWHLVRCYGYWGLAFLETLLRLADGARSAEEQRQGRESP